jgi:hypothetical protein
MPARIPLPPLKDLRDQATGKVVTTAAAVATDPVGTARGLARSGAKTALRLPVRAGVAATGPAMGMVARALAVAGTAIRTGRQVRDRVLPGRGESGWSGPAEPPQDLAPRAASIPDAVTDAAPDVAPSEPPRAAPDAPPEAAVLAGAPGTADAAVARAERAVGSTVADGASLCRDELPLEDYDHLTLPALRARLTRLDLSSLVQLRDYEKAHANRLPVVTMLDNRIAKVTSSNGS